VGVVDIPFELVGEIASAGAVAEAGNVECVAAPRHDGFLLWLVQFCVRVVDLGSKLQNRWSSSGRCDEGIDDQGNVVRLDDSAVVGVEL
jgi:hypothetical protein